MRRLWIGLAFVYLATMPPRAASQTMPRSNPLVNQPVTQPASQPTTTPASAPTTAETPNPLRSPARMMEYFLDAVRAAEEQPERLAEASACLDFALVDKEVARSDGPSYARQLGQLVERLISAGAFDPATLPDNPAAETQVIGQDPLLLVLERREQLWHFAPSTVAEVPRLHALLSQAVAEPAVQAEPLPESGPSGRPVPEALRSPRALVTHFLVSLSEAQTNPARYGDALACLNFSGLDPNTAEEYGPQHAEKLGEILQAYLDIGVLRIEDLPDEPEFDYHTIGQDPILLILLREPDGRWLFSARTVAQIPAMHTLCRTPPEWLPVRGKARGKADGAAPNVPAEFRSPRATMETFLRTMGENDLKAAARCLNLSELPSAERQARAWTLAGKLLLIMRRHAVVVLQKIPDDPDFQGPYKHLVSRYGRIEIGRVEKGDERVGEWLFTPATVRSIERLYEGWETRPLLPQFQDAPGISFWTLPSLWLRERIISPVLKRTGLGLQYWQWIGLGLVLLAGWLVQLATSRVFPRLARRVLRAPGLAAGYQVAPRHLRPWTLLALLLTWWTGAQLLDLGTRVGAIVWPALRLLLVAIGAWAVYRSIDLLSDYSAARAARRETRLNDVLLPLARKSLKVVVVAVGGTMVLTVVGLEVGPLLAGLGIGGLAFSFAAKDTIANFFGSVNIVLDRPFQVGDWVRIGQQEGKVEAVGLRSSRLRTFRDSQLTIPNAEIMNAVIDNMGRRRYRRTFSTLAVTYATTPQQIEAFCEGIRELIRRHPSTRKDEYHVYVKELGSSTIEILLNCFHETPDWESELRARHNLLLDIVRLAKRLGVEFAFPTQTVHVHQKDGRIPASEAPSAADTRFAAVPSSAAPSPVPADIDAAIRFGREQAAALVTIADRADQPKQTGWDT